MCIWSTRMRISCSNSLVSVWLGNHKNKLFIVIGNYEYHKIVVSKSTLFRQICCCLYSNCKILTPAKGSFLLFPFDLRSRFSRYKLPRVWIQYPSGWSTPIDIKYSLIFYETRLTVVLQTSSDLFVSYWLFQYWRPYRLSHL